MRTRMRGVVGAGGEKPPATRLIWLMLLAEKLCPQSSSVMALTLRVETPCTYISASAATRTFSLRW